MDDHSLSKLEFGTVRERLAEHARSSLAKEWIADLRPQRDIEYIREQLARTGEVMDLLACHMEPPLAGLRDVRLPVKRAQLGVQLEIEQAVDIRDVADLSGRAYEYWLRLTSDSPRVERLLSDVTDLRPLARVIDESIDERGKVRDDATPELASVRAQLAEWEARIQKELGRLLRQPEIRSALRYSQATMSGDHHVLPVAVNHRHKVAGVVHRTSASGETVYIEPTKVAEISAEMSLLKSAEQREIRRVLRRLTDAVASKGRELATNLDVLTHLDFITAKARLARDGEMTIPEISSHGRLRLEQARHPLLERVIADYNARATTSEQRDVVPITVHLGEAFEILIITGPNTGGKTVVLKTVGLLGAMALSGLPIPARAGSIVPMFDEILVDIGDEQSIEQSLSTFSAHMTRITQILRIATSHSLVLLDELGAGTDPSEGAALGQAILDELRERGCRALVTTHLGDLKSYALRHARAENGAVEFDPETLRPTYRLLMGQFGESCALKVARRLQVPRGLLAKAYRHLRRRRGKGAHDLRQLQEMREATEKAREEALDAQRKADQAQAEFRRRENLLQQEADVHKEIERFRTTLQAGDAVRVLKFDKNGTIKRIDRRRELAAVLVGAVEWELPLSDLFPLPRNPS
ncbi:DNA strand exchange inhibitor protein [bacterium]|nr:DNA strand exchange inhibitor protein [bacterium]